MRKHLVIIATSALCLLLVAAVPVPSANKPGQSDGIEIVQIPLADNKVRAFSWYYPTTQNNNNNIHLTGVVA